MELTQKLITKIGVYNRTGKNIQTLYRKTIDDFKKVGLILTEDEIEKILKLKKIHI